MHPDDEIDPTSQRLPFYNPLDQTGQRVWHDYTLLMPVCAVGNVGQLACDLIISTLLHRREAQLAGRIYSPALMPVVGPNPYTKSTPFPPTTSTEVYVSEKRKLVIIQQRTSYFKNLKGIFVTELIDWIKESRFAQILVLSSSFSQCNPDLSQLGKSGPIYEFLHSIVTNQFDSDKSEWQNLNIKPLEDRRKIEVIRDGFMSFLPGSGLTKSLIKAFEKSSIPAAFLIAFCSEGINIQDCYEVANMVNRYLNLSDDIVTDVKDNQMNHNGLLKSTLLCDSASGDTNSLLKSSNQNTTQLVNWIEPCSWKCF